MLLKIYYKSKFNKYVSNIKYQIQNIGPTLSANITQHKSINIKTFLKEK